MTKNIMKKLSLIKTVMFVGVFSLLAAGSLFGARMTDNQKANTVLKITGPVYFKIAEDIPAIFTPSDKEYTAVRDTGGKFQIGRHDVKLSFKNPKQYKAKYAPSKRKSPDLKHKYVGLKPEKGGDISIKVNGSSIDFPIGSASRLETGTIEVGGDEYEIVVRFEVVKETWMLYADPSDKSSASAYLISVESVKKIASGTEDAKLAAIKDQQLIAEEALKAVKRSIDSNFAFANASAESARMAAEKAEEIAKEIPGNLEAQESAANARDAATEAADIVKRKAAERKAAAEEAARQRAAADEAARKKAAAEEAARQKAAAEAAKRKAAAEEAARQKAAADVAARQRVAAEDAARKRAADEEAARQAKLGELINKYKHLL